MRRGFKRATIVSFLAFLTWSGGITLAVEPSDNPILLIPGILGSQVWARLNKTSVDHFPCSKTSGWYNIWLSLEQLVYPFEKCASDNMMLNFNPDTKEFTGQEGVDIAIRDFGNTTSIEYLDPSLTILEPASYFHDMVDHFVKQGYVRGETIRAAPYDWRFAPVGLTKLGYFNKVKSLIEEMYNTYKNRVTIIVHSMGGPVSLYFLTQVVDQQWKDMYIKQYITLSAVWAGSIKSVRSIISGDNEGIILDRPIWGRASQRTFQSTLWLLPPSGDVWGKDLTVAYTPTGNYTAYDYDKLMSDLGYTHGPEMYEILRDPTATFPAPNVTTYCYYGLGMDTPFQLHYKEKGYPDASPDVTTCDGDGTVPKISLTVCERWKDQQSYPVSLKSFSPVEHVHVLRNAKVIAAVSQIILGK